MDKAVRNNICSCFGILLLIPLAMVVIRIIAGTLEHTSMVITLFRNMTSVFPLLLFGIYFSFFIKPLAQKNKQSLTPVYIWSFLAFLVVLLLNGFCFRLMYK